MDTPKIYRGMGASGEYEYYCGKELAVVQEYYKTDHPFCRFEDLEEIGIEDVPETEGILCCGLRYRERPFYVKEHNRRAGRLA